MRKTACICLLIAGITLFAYLEADADSKKRMHSVPFDVFIFSEAFADDEGYHYGKAKKGRYGERKAIHSEDEAQMMLREYFPNKKFKIGKIKKRKFYFEAEIRDKDDNLIDRVIIDTRTGRIRSEY